MRSTLAPAKPRAANSAAAAANSRSRLPGSGCGDFGFRAAARGFRAVEVRRLTGVMTNQLVKVD
jgi:hypothetical protein